MTNPQGVDPSLHVNLPGFNGSGSTSIDDILSSISGGQALFKPNPNVTNQNTGNVDGVSGGSINGSGNANTGNGGIGNVSNPNAENNGNVQNAGVNTSPTNPQANYLIESRTQYTSLDKFYGSDYFVDQVGLDGSSQFLGTSVFDAAYVIQQEQQATGQSYLGNSYQDPSKVMKALIDNAADEKIN